MTPEELVELHLVDAWVASLDADADTWHESPWAHVIFLIGQQLDASELDALIETRLA